MASLGNSRWPVVLAVTSLSLALTVATALAAVGSNDVAGTSDIPSVSPDVVMNGGFEQGEFGWRTNHPEYQFMTLTQDARLAGEAAAVLSSSRYGHVVLNDLTSTVTSTEAGQVYWVTAYVRADGGAVRGSLRIREVLGSELVAKSSARFAANVNQWSRVRLAYSARVDGSKLDLNVLGTGVPLGVSLLIDDVSMTIGGLGPDPSPSPSPPVDPSIPPVGGCVDDPMGIPSGNAFLGAAVNGSSNISVREHQLGQPLALRRTYFHAGEIDAAVRTAKEDLAVGRLPWISFKEPHSWSAMAGGAGDAWAAQLADALATVPGPVWLAVHHEPEKDGDMAQWTAMQARIAPIIHRRTDNVAYSVIYSGWNTYGRDRDTVASKWPGDENVDILAIDAYNDYGAHRGANAGTKVLELKQYYEKMQAWASAHGTAWAIGETGQTRAAAVEDPTWLERSFRDMVALGGAGLSYYDSSANSVADWTLDDPIKFAKFAALQQESATLC